VLQPDSALHIHRQAAIDLLYLLDGLTEGQVVLETPEGEPVPLYPDRIVVMGHSQGALTTSIALPWAGEAIDGAVLSGGGGLLAITAVERDADFDFPALITGLLGFADDEPLSEMHPVLGLVQSLVEPTDPINYARYWYAEDGGYTNSEPTPVLHLSGIRDDATPYRTAEALAAAAGMPFAGERFAKAEGLLLAGLDSQSFPVSDNLTDWNGQPITAGLSQWADGTHFVVFEEPDARDLVRNFVYGTLQGDGPVIDEGPPPLEEDEAP
jgi:pimeloyl-ACP methyl ester carboxylesterase